MLVNSVFEYIKGYFYEQYLESIISFNHSMGSGLTTPINETTAKTLAGNQFDATFFSEHNDDGIIPPEVATQWATEHNITKTDYEINSLTKEENKTFNPTNPKCSSGHNMVLSDYAGGNYTGGYSCDYCSMNSTQGICGVAGRAGGAKNAAPTFASTAILAFHAVPATTSCVSLTTSTRPHPAWHGVATFADKIPRSLVTLDPWSDGTARSVRLIFVLTVVRHHFVLGNQRRPTILLQLSEPAASHPVGSRRSIIAWLVRG